MDYNFQSKIKPISTTANQKANGCKMITNKTVNSTNSLVKPRQMSTLHPPSNQARPTSPKISKKTNSSIIIQPSQTNFITSRIKPSSANQLKSTSSSLKKPTTTFNQATTSTKPLSVNSSANRLNNQQQQSNSRNGSSTNLKSSLNSLKSKDTKKLMVKDTINNSSFVPRETLVKLTKKHEELTNKYNISSKVINKNQLLVDGLSCLVNYMAIDLDAFENPNLKKRINYLENVEKELKLDVSNLKADNNKLDNELQFEKHRSHKEKENLLTMFQLEMKTVEKNYQENIRIEQTKRDKAEKDLLYLKQNLSKDKKIDFLNKEIDSLKIVLELKEKEIKDLRYKLDRTVVDQDEISQLKNERDNLSLAKEQLEYSLNQKNEELKFVLQENTSLASLNSLTSTPLPINDRNNNSIVKKRKNLAKKQKLDVNESNFNNKNDDHLFVKPTISMNLHRDRFIRPSVDLEMNKNDDYFQEDNNLKEHDDDKIFENNSNDKLFTDNLFNENNDKSFTDNDKSIFNDNNFNKFSELNKLEDELDFIKPLIDRPINKKSLDESVLKNLEKQQTDSIDNSFNQLNDSFNKEMEISLYKSFDDKSLELNKSNHFNNSFNHSNQHNSNNFNESNFNNSTHHNLTNSFNNKSSSENEIIDKQFNIDDIKERCFKARIERESPNKNNQLKETNDDKFKRPFDILDNYPKDNFVIKTCQIVSDENEISIIKNNRNQRPESSSVLDSGFCDL